MALNSDILKKSLDAIQKSNPGDIDKASSTWALAVYDYSKVALAVGAVVPTLNLVALTAAFATSMKKMTFMDDLGQNLLTWWSSTPWSGPGFVGVTVPPAPMNSSALGKQIMDGISDIATFLSENIDTWTKTIKVTVTNVSSGITSVSAII